MTRLRTIAEACELLGVSRYRLDRFIKSRQLAAVDVSSRSHHMPTKGLRRHAEWRFRDEDLDAFIQQRRQAPAAEVEPVVRPRRMTPVLQLEGADRYIGGRR